MSGRGLFNRPGGGGDNDLSMPFLRDVENGGGDSAAGGDEGSEAQAGHRSATARGVVELPSELTSGFDTYTAPSVADAIHAGAGAGAKAILIAPINYMAPHHLAPHHATPRNTTSCTPSLTIPSDPISCRHSLARPPTPKPSAHSELPKKDNGGLWDVRRTQVGSFDWFVDWNKVKDLGLKEERAGEECQISKAIREAALKAAHPSGHTANGVGQPSSKKGRAITISTDWSGRHSRNISADANLYGQDRLSRNDYRNDSNDGGHVRTFASESESGERGDGEEGGESGGKGEEPRASYVEFDRQEGVTFEKQFGLGISLYFKTIK